MYHVFVEAETAHKEACQVMCDCHVQEIVVAASTDTFSCRENCNDTSVIKVNKTVLIRRLVVRHDLYMNYLVLIFTTKVIR